jgi:hypothetical protein
MSILVWVMIAIAIWHFTVWLPDSWWGGIQGALIAAIFGAVIGGLVWNGFAPPTRDTLSLLNIIDCLPGIAVGLGVSWFIGKKKESEAHQQGEVEGPGRMSESSN